MIVSARLVYKCAFILGVFRTKRVRSLVSYVDWRPIRHECLHFTYLKVILQCSMFLDSADPITCNCLAMVLPVECHSIDSDWHVLIQRSPFAHSALHLLLLFTCAAAIGHPLLKPSSFALFHLTSPPHNSRQNNNSASTTTSLLPSWHRHRPLRNSRPAHAALK